LRTISFASSKAAARLVNATDTEEE